MLCFTMLPSICLVRPRESTNLNQNGGFCGRYVVPKLSKPTIECRSAAAVFGDVLEKFVCAGCVSHNINISEIYVCACVCMCVCLSVTQEGLNLQAEQ